jgi:hypothetical protein
MNHRFGTPDGKWAKVEIMGHVEHVARCLEVPFLDGKALRVCDEVEGSPILYGAGAIFSIRWLTEEEGERESDRKHAEAVEARERHARYSVIGAIQQAIREAMEGRKMSRAAVYAAVRAAMSDVTEADFGEAFGDMCFTKDAGKDEVIVYWQDQDESPF